jgi:hypothetical protein
MVARLHIRHRAASLRQVFNTLMEDGKARRKRPQHLRAPTHDLDMPEPIADADSPRLANACSYQYARDLIE